MAYCVHCGVKLGPDEKTCPLCGTPVFDPKAESASPAHLRPDSIDLFPRKRVNWPFVCRLLAAFFLAAGGVMALCDVLTTAGLGWAWFALGGCCLGAGFLMIPAWNAAPAKVLSPYLGTVLSLLCVAAATNGFRWFLFLALPIATAAALYSLLCLWLALKKKLRVFYRVALCLFLLIVTLVVIEILTDLYTAGEVHLFWSVYAIIPLFFVAAFFTLVARSRRVVEYIKKNTFLS